MRILSSLRQLNTRRHLYGALGLLLLLSVGLSGMAQNAPRDYAIERAQISLSADETRINIVVDVVNNGGDAVRETQVNIANISDGGRIVAEAPLLILASGERTRLDFSLITADFTPASTLNLRIEAGVDLYELAGTTISQDNVQLVSLTIPTTVTRPPDTNTDSIGGTTNAPFFALNEAGGITVNGQSYSRDEILLGAGVAVVALLLFWLVTVILRLIFRRAPNFGNWQPPYATVPNLHPDTVIGRRQAWQQHAQNNLILSPPHEGAPYAVKNLLGRDGRWLGGWRIVGMRCSQYDQYGRVTRTQFIATGKLLKQMNRILPAYGTPHYEKRIQQVTRTIQKGAKKTFGKKTLFLPVSIDVRFEGASGDVRIQFQLYQAQSGRWILLDEWEPQIGIMTPHFQEQMSYTIHGQTNGEKPRTYFQRLERDLAWLFAQTFRPHTTPVEPVAPTDANKTQTPVQPQRSVPQFDIPDTLTNMQPVDDVGAMPDTDTHEPTP